MTERSALIKAGWRQVRGKNLYKDPKTGRFYILAHAVIVQQGYAQTKPRTSRLKIELKGLLDAAELHQWDPDWSRLDELYPVGSVYGQKKKPRRK